MGQTVIGMASLNYEHAGRPAAKRRCLVVEQEQPRLFFDEAEEVLHLLRGPCSNATMAAAWRRVDSLLRENACLLTPKAHYLRHVCFLQFARDSAADDWFVYTAERKHRNNRITRTLEDLD